MPPSPDHEFLVAEPDAGIPLGKFLRDRIPGTPWRTVRMWIETGKVRVGGSAETRGGRTLAAGEAVEVVLSTPRPDRSAGKDLRFVHVDGHLLVIEKPAGLVSVPFESGETGTALHLARDRLRREEGSRSRAALFAVHRIDRETSGLLLFARTRAAESRLGRVFAGHDLERSYRFAANGIVRPGRIESRLVDDRGDGLRGSTRASGRGKPAVTDLRVVGALRGATLGEATLETGRTHQIRIHLAESGHPVVGEKVYVRDFLAGGGRPIESPRLLLHAAVLALDHPATGNPLRFESAPPPDFEAVVAGLRPDKIGPAPDREC